MINNNKKINLVNIFLIIYVFSIIFFNDGATILKIIKVFFAAICVLNMIYRRKLYIDKYIIWMLVFTSFGTLSMNWAVSRENVKSILTTLVLNNICNFLIINLVYDDRKRLNLILKTIIFSSITLGLKTAIQYGPLVFIEGSRGASDGTMSANTIGMVAAIAGVLSVYYLKTSDKYKTLYLISVIINIIIVILSASRKAIFFLLIPLVIYYVLNSKNILATLRKIILSAFAICVVFVIIMKIPFLYEGVGNRIETMINGFMGTGETDASTSTRLNMIEAGMEWFKDKPYIGYGLNNYKYLYGTSRDSQWGVNGVYAHNNYVELLVDVGIIGTAIYYSIYLMIVVQGIKSLNQKDILQIIFLGILLACIINEYGNVAYYAKFNQLILVLSWLIICNKKDSKEQPKQS